MHEKNVVLYCCLYGWVCLRLLMLSQFILMLCVTQFCRPQPTFPVFVMV